MGLSQAAANTEPIDIFIFGGTGDLALKKLIPALYLLFQQDLLTSDSRVVACSRKRLSHKSFREMAKSFCQDYLEQEHYAKESWIRFEQLLFYNSLNATQLTDYPSLLHFCGNKTRLFYLSTSPSFFGVIARNLQLSKLINANSRVALEKPLGVDLKTANAINKQIATVFKEHQVFRIDHYLGKETVQNILAMRFANVFFEPIWSGEYIEHVQISVLETTGIEERGEYYEKAGAMRDMVQNHLLQLLCLMAMDQPKAFTANEIHNEKVKILRKLKPIKGLDVQDKTVRGQYGADSHRTMPPYYYEKGIHSETNVETFVALKAEIENDRWRGTPFYLRTGKRLAAKCSEIVVHFKNTMNLFPSPFGFEGNRLRIQLQPEERIALEVLAKRPGQGMALMPVDLDLNFQAERKIRHWEAYERLLLDAIQGDTTLFMRRDEVEAAWRWVDPIIESWGRYHATPKSYQSGSFGPEKSDLLIQTDGYKWQNEF